MRFLLALLLLAVSGSQAWATVKFCNNFEHPVQFAVAFQDQDGWVSEGWISVAPKACQTDSKHADLTEFYWRGETDWIKTKGGRTQWSWGKDRQFNVKDGSFTLKNSDETLKGAHLVGFIGPVKINAPSIAVTLTIVDAKGTMTEIASEAASLKSDPDYQACQTASGDEALAACDRAIGAGKFSEKLLANLHLNRGVEREAKKDLDGALADYEEAIRIDATAALGYANRAGLRYKKREYDAAIQDLDKAIELDPNYLRAYTDRADAYREKGDLSKAIEDYKKALTLNPSDQKKARIENALSNAYVDRGVDQKEASAELADYDEALRINPNNVTGLNNRGAVYTLKGEYDKAIQDLD
ncbi:MAG TPA: tetratricopeptide repeat protein, partial [Methyloceanibacter sp.]|nr:tetratricopeptide repeat protein [Methyloceanibacter sp.]